MALDHTDDVFLAVPSRLGLEDVPNWKKCSAYVASHFSENLCEALESVFESMNMLHNEVVKVCHPDKNSSQFNDTFVSERAVPYCKLVVQAQGHLPLHSGRISDLYFHWKDSFPLSQDSKVSLSKGEEVGNIFSSDANLELLSCAYNIAAGYSALAVNETTVASMDGLKSAHGHFQQAAGYFEVLEGAIHRFCETERKKVNDFHPLCLSALKKYSLAQAHHAAYLSAKLNQKPHSLLSRLAVKAAELYEDVRLGQTPVHSSTTGMQLGRHAEATALIFRARSHLHLALAAEKETEMGLATAHYYKASDYLDQAVPLSAACESHCSAWVASVRDAGYLGLNRSEKANNTICRQPVPDDVPAPVGLASGLGKALLPAPFLSFEEPQKGKDPFFGIIPADTAKASRQWRKSSELLLQKSVERAKKMQEKVTSSLSQMGGALLDSAESKGEQKIPESLMKELQQLRQGSTGNVPLNAVLLQKIQFGDQVVEALQKKLNEAEEQSGAQLTCGEPFRQQYGALIWQSEFPDPSKSEMYISLTQLIAEQRNGIQQYIVSPLQQAKSELYEHADNLTMLEMPLKDLEVVIPAAAPSDRLMALREGLKTLMAHKSATVSAQNDAIKSAEEMIQSDQLVYKLSATSKENQESVLAEETQKLKSLLSTVDNYSGEYDAVLRKVEEKLSAMAQEQSMDPQTVEAQKFLNGLYSGVQRYQKIQKDIDKVVEYCRRSKARVEELLSSVAAFRESVEASMQAAHSRLEQKLAQRMGGNFHTPQATGPAPGNLYAPPEIYSTPPQSGFLPYGAASSPAPLNPYPGYGYMPQQTQTTPQPFGQWNPNYNPNQR